VKLGVQIAVSQKEMNKLTQNNNKTKKIKKQNRLRHGSSERVLA
jgi:hypothetical protein